jgi:quinoprotein glucose dehydrogenase
MDDPWSLGARSSPLRGLVFVVAAQDDTLHAFGVDTGQLLWEYQLPAGGPTSPMTYVLDGPQYVVIAAEGGACPTAR